MEKFREKFEIREYAEARIYRNGEFVELVKFPDASFNSISSTGKGELAEIVGGLDTKYFDSMWVVVDGTVSTLKSLSPPTESGGTLTLEPTTPFSIPGDYTAVLTGNGALGSGNWYSSISTSLSLPANSEVDFTVQIIITGAESGYYGHRIAAARWGNVSGSNYNSPLSTISTYNGTSLLDSDSTNNSVSGNTLTVTHSNAFTGPDSIDKVEYRTAVSGSDGKFDMFDGFTISVDATTEVFFEAEFVFG